MWLGPEVPLGTERNHWPVTNKSHTELNSANGLKELGRKPCALDENHKI